MDTDSRSAQGASSIEGFKNFLTSLDILFSLPHADPYSVNVLVEPGKDVVLQVPNCCWDLQGTCSTPEAAPGASTSYTQAGGSSSCGLKVLLAHIGAEGKDFTAVLSHWNCCARFLSSYQCSYMLSCVGVS